MYLNFHKDFLMKHVTPRIGPFFAPGLYFEQNWYWFTRKIKAFGLVISDEIFKISSRIFSSFDLVNCN